MKKILALGGTLALALSLSACGGGGKAADAPAPAPETKTGIISTTDDTTLPEVKKEEKAITGAKALDEKWETEAEKVRDSKGWDDFGSSATSSFQAFDDDKIESYEHYSNFNDEWKAGDKVKFTFICQTKEPMTTQVFVSPQEDEEDKGQLTEFGCGVDKPAEGTWEYTLPMDSSNLTVNKVQRPIEGYFVLHYEKM